MAPPTGQRCLVQVEKSKTRTIKFKNGVPPKVIRSRDFSESYTRKNSNDKLHLAEYEFHLKKENPGDLNRQIESSGKKSKSQAQIVNDLVVNERRKGFIPSVAKHGYAKSTNSKRSPFSPPPTMTELRSLTKKIGRFYTVNSESSAQTPRTNRNQQKVILDIEKALSNEDVNGLEKCYRRIFNGESAPVRTLVKNQYLPNQRSRQASYPLDVNKSSPTSASSILSYTRNPNVIQKSSERRWSVDSIKDKRLPYVPAPYVRNETRSSPAKTHGLRHVSDKPVMFSSSSFDHKKRSKSYTPSTAILTLDPGHFPQLHSSRGQHAEQPGAKSNVNGTFIGSKKQIISKTSSIWNQRAPNSTPEPPSDNLESRRPLAPHVVTSQFHKTNSHSSRSNDTKRVGIKDDTDSTNSQSSNTQVDRKKISEESETNVMTSVRISEIEGTNINGESYPAANEKGTNLLEEEGNQSAGELDADQPSEKLIISSEEAVSLETKKIIVDLARGSVEQHDLNNSSAESLEHKGSNDVALEEQTELNHADLEEQPAIIKTNQSSESVLQDITIDNQMIETNIEEENSELEISMDNVTVVVVNVTTDQGEDVNADIYEYECQTKNHEDKTAEVEKSKNDENIENSKAAAKNRKEELEALLKEHSNIVEKIKTLSADDEQS